MEEDKLYINRDVESNRTKTRRRWTFVELLGLLCPMLLLWRIWTFCQDSRNGCRYKRPGQEYEPVNGEPDSETKLREKNNEQLRLLKDENTLLYMRIDELSAKIEEKDNKISKLQQENKTNEREKKDSLDRVSEERDEMKHQKDKEIAKLQHEKEILEKEKEDALNRVSQLVSVKLRDNNPNIVDLSDPYRPTKLAEIFSELYDNEWTAAYTFLEDKFESEQIDSFLLDIIMESYTFCNEKAHLSWSYVKQWFLPEGAHNEQTLRKGLKDGQKLQAQTLVPQLGKEFCDHITEKCNVEQLRSVLTNKELAAYIHLCVKVCFLMAVNDPPVIIECPNRGKTDIKFNKEEFKEYTKRGPFLAYYVWPLMRLHAGGPLLGKGVAQGADDPATRVAWTWST